MKRLATGLVLAVLACFPAVSSAALLTFDVDGIDSFNSVGDPGNQVRDFFLAPNARVNGIGWNVVLEAFHPSWLSDLTVGLGSSDPSQDLVLLRPAFGENQSGTGTFASSIIDLESLGLAFNVGLDGILRVEFFEAFDDDDLSPDGRWNSGTITVRDDRPVDVPEPGALGLLALGLAGMAWRRRRDPR